MLPQKARSRLPVLRLVLRRLPERAFDVREREAAVHPVPEPGIVGVQRVASEQIAIQRPDLPNPLAFRRVRQRGPDLLKREIARRPALEAARVRVPSQHIAVQRTYRLL